ncbi:MAG: prolyl oligopeptidase family serine peptidase [Planctomycetota bacterium]
MSRKLLLAILSMCFVCLSTCSSFAQTKKKSSDDEKELTLERLFPEESIFGPSARSTAFSADGRYAAYLYRPYNERRHGNDLWIYDFKEEKNTRVTDLAILAKFQRSARVVKQDRLAKHKQDEKKDDNKSSKPEKKKANEDKKDEADEGEEKEKTAEEIEAENEIVNSVSEKDADDKYAPRYEGISGFKWHPKENSMLVFSQGDVYHIADVTAPELKRLTKTTSNESKVDFLPDGSGYTYNVDSAVYRIRFDNHLIEQLNPRLESGRELSNYSISPDGKKLVLVARTPGGFSSSGGRKVDIIRYRDRFAKADSISRTVSDDEIKPQDVFVYLFDLEEIGWEDSELLQVFHKKIDDPRDVISRPNWSLDSQKITFCFFNQKDDVVEIRVGEFPDEKEYKKRLAEAEKKAEKNRKEQVAEAKKKDEEENRRARAPRVSRAPLTVEFEAKSIYEFKHDGGPNTPRMVSPDWAADSKHVVFVSEMSGFRHVHLLDTLYQSTRQLTSGHYEVYPIDFSEDHKTLYVTATKDSPAQTMVYSVDIESGDMERLSNEDGVYRSVAVSDDGKRMLANYATYGKLVQLVVQDGKKSKPITESHPEEAVELTQWKPEFFEYENREGHTIHGMMIKPDDWNPKSKNKYPLLIYVYGGPLGTSKSVVDASYRSESYFFGGYMAKKHGYLSVVIDPRGQSGYGGLFEKANYEQVGKPQVDDLVDGVKHLTENFNVDTERVGIHGWSFGGFQTQMCLYTEPDVFKVGMAGAGPTEWENYNAWYTTGTVGPSKKGSPDQKKYSLRPLAKNLKGKLLLVHGMEDTNVLFQDTVAIYRELLKAGKEAHVELFLDPTGGHGLGGDVKTLNKMRKYEEFLLRTLGSDAKKSDDK